MRKLESIVALAAASLMMAVSAFPQANQGQGRALITILPSGAGDQLATVGVKDLKIKVNGKDSRVDAWTPMRGREDRLELVFLIDGSARSSLASQFEDITSFVKEMPTGAKIAIAYMDSGRAAFEGPLSSDPAQVLRALHVTNAIPGSNASPYFCLSDLAKNWPSKDAGARREVVMITNGVDNYERRFDPDDPYVQAAITDSVRAGLVVFSIYWHDTGLANSTEYETNAGQNLLQIVTQATGGYSYWQGSGNPVSFDPYLKDFRRRLRNQYAITFSAPNKGKPEVANLKLELKVPSAKVEAPQMVLVTPTPAVAALGQ
jgi:hypothetical protein